MTHWVYSRKKSLGVAEKVKLSPTRRNPETLTQWDNFLGFPIEHSITQWDTAPNGAIFSVFVEKVLDPRYPLG